MKSIKILSLIVVIPLLILSCSKDKGTDNHTKGVLIIRDTEYALIGGNIYYEGQHGAEQGYIFYIVMYSSGINLETEKGTGHMVSVEMYSETNDDVKNGTYSFDNETGAIGTFDGLISLDFNTETWAYSASYRPTSGTIMISKSGVEYEMTMDVKVNEYDDTDDLIDSDVEISCHYQGKLTRKNFE
jgi:hypothetical protein